MAETFLSHSRKALLSLVSIYFDLFSVEQRFAERNPNSYSDSQTNSEREATQRSHSFIIFTTEKQLGINCLILIFSAGTSI